MGAQAAARKARQAERAREDAEANRLPKWTPFVRVTPVMAPAKRERLIQDTIRLAAASGFPMTSDEVVEMMEAKAEQEMYQNSRYTVLVFRDEVNEPGCPAMIHLSIRRNDRARPREERWRDFQRIKSELVGPDNEGAELYPAEDRVADCADQFHIFVLADPELRFPFGFKQGMRAGPQPGGAAAQTPFDADD